MLSSAVSKKEKRGERLEPSSSSNRTRTRAGKERRLTRRITEKGACTPRKEKHEHKPASTRIHPSKHSTLHSKTKSTNTNTQAGRQAGIRMHPGKHPNTGARTHKKQSTNTSRQSHACTQANTVRRSPLQRKLFRVPRSRLSILSCPTHKEDERTEVHTDPLLAQHHPQ